MKEKQHEKVGLACFIVGCLLVFLIDANITRIIGVPMIFAGIFLGVHAIASPDFLAGDREDEAR